MKLIGLIITIGIWGFLMFSKDPLIVKNRNNTQKWVYTGLALFVIWNIVQGVH
jgi:hypothetical protein